MRTIHQIDLGGFSATIERKDIKNVHLSVYPPEGAVRVSAPRHLSMDHLRAYVISKLDWIKQQRRQLLSQDRETVREFKERESHYLWGKRYLLSVVEEQTAPTVERKHRHLILKVRPDTSSDKRREIMESWYRNELRSEALPLIAKWEQRMGVTMNRLFIQRMKTKWGSCSPARRSIRLNTELAKKPKTCLEYLVVHELVHLIEPTHNSRFIALMDDLLPEWRQLRRLLNQLPLRHVDWEY